MCSEQKDPETKVNFSFYPQGLFSPGFTRGSSGPSNSTEASQLAKEAMAKMFRTYERHTNATTAAYHLRAKAVALKQDGKFAESARCVVLSICFFGDNASSFM
jgi:hypothetical protein